MLFSAVVVTLIAGLPGAGPAAAIAAPVPSACTETARADWLDLFVSVMQDVLWLMGGDAQDIDTGSPDKAMAGFRARAAELGVPAGLSSTDAAALRAAIDRMDVLLSDAPNTASEDEVRLTRSTLSQLRAAPTESSLTRSSP
ncbi:MAG: hypothetical protein IT436_11205 [Phycisphaerales bacterium]|nr:hypothetical protein [Phycisphaerales bacterium]